MVDLSSLPGSCSRDMIYYLSALLTPAIAIGIGAIGYMQWRTNHLRFKHELFDRRYKIFNAAIEFVAKITVTRQLSNEDIRVYMVETSGAHFVYNDDFGRRLGKIYDHAESFGQLGRKADTETEEAEVNIILEKRDKIIGFMAAQMSEIRADVAPYLKLY